MANVTLYIIIVVAIIFGIIAYSIYANKVRLKREQERLRLLTTVTQPDRGTSSERELVLHLLKNGVHPKAIFHDLYVNNRNGTYSQIDLVVATSAGIFVFEVKDYSGWIFGKGHQKQWTQVLAYGDEKNRFYNPVMQNRTHINCLKRQLAQFENIPFYSIIVFYGSSIFRDVSFIPDGTFLIKPYEVIGVMNLISTNYEPARYTDKAEVSYILRQAVENGVNREIRIQHIQNIKDRMRRQFQ